MAKNIEDARQDFVFLVQRELKKCSKCGSCASVCPVYAEKRSEAFCSRGKMQLARAILQDGLPLSKRLALIFNDCLICLACKANCPGGVRMDLVVLAARSLLAMEGRQSRVKKMFCDHLLAAPDTLRVAMKCGGLLQPLLFRGVPESSGLRRRFPLPFLAKDQPIPRVASLPFRSRVPEVLAAAPGTHMGEVMYFVGCAAEYLFPTIGEAVVYILRTLGFDVIIPAGQGCCGTPVEVAGETDVLQGLISANLDAFGQKETPVVTACGSGGLMLRQEYPRLLSGKDRGRAEQLASRTRDITEFLIERCGLSAIQKHFVRSCQQVLTYHESCHLGRGLGVHKQPRQLLQAAASKFVEMEQAGRCCGSGGTYGAAHWDTSRAILKRKVEFIHASGAALVAAGCPSCVLQLETGLANAGIRGTALHTAEILAWSMGYMPERVEERARFERLG